MSKKTKSKRPHPAVQNIMVISRRHLSQETADAFRASYDFGISCCFISDGCLVMHLDEEFSDRFWPDDLRTAVDFAADQCCSWLAITPTGEEIPALLQYS